MLIGIAFNHPQPQIYGEKKDKISEDAVLEEVSDVQEILFRLGHNVELLPLKYDIGQFIRKLSIVNPDCLFNLC